VCKIGYSRWENFEVAIKRAISSCEVSGEPVDNHFRDVTKIVKAGVTQKPVTDIMLTRYSCYLIAHLLYMLLMGMSTK